MQLLCVEHMILQHWFKTFLMQCINTVMALVGSKINQYLSKCV